MHSIAKPRQLAAAIMKDDQNGILKINSAMDTGDEKWYTLKIKFRFT
jgi:hypothetical protein